MFTKEQVEFLDTMRVPYPYKRKFVAETQLLLKGYFEEVINYERFILNIKVLMPLHGFFNAEQFSVSIGMNKFYIARLLRKTSPCPTFKTISAIAQGLRVKPSTLLLADLKNEFVSTVSKLESQKEGVQ